MIGKLHPLLVHLPIGFIILTIFLEFLSWTGNRRSAFTWVVQGSLILTILAGIGSIVTGIFLVESNPWAGSNLHLHRILAFVTVISFLVVFILKRFYPNYRRSVSTIVSILLLLLISITGHFGGTLTHGESYLSLADESTNIKEFSDVPVDSIQVFTEFIKPVLEQKCQRCHNSSEMAGNLDVSNYQSLIATGKSGKTIIASNSNASELFRRVTMSPDEKKFMPPSGDPLSYSEIRILKYWIESGAGKDIVFSPASTDMELKTILASNYQIDLEAKPYYEKVKVDPLSESNMARLKESGIKVSFLSDQNYLLDISLNKELTNDQLQLIWELGEKVAFLDLSESNVEDEWLTGLADLVNLVRLDVHSTQLDGLFLQYLTPLDNLESLNLFNTEVDDTYLDGLRELNNLKRVYTWQSRITEAGISGLQGGRDVEVIYGP